MAAKLSKRGMLNELRGRIGNNQHLRDKVSVMFDHQMNLVLTGYTHEVSYYARDNSDLAGFARAQGYKFRELQQAGSFIIEEKGDHE